MLPAELVALAFVDPVHGSDAALVDRAQDELPAGCRLLVLGVGRVELLRTLAESGFRVVGVDTSRTALRAASSALGDTPGIELLVADPRELDVPGTIDAALITSTPWRAVVLRDDRVSVLRELRAAARPGARLLVDVEDVPAEGASGASDHVTWRRDAGAETIEAQPAGSDAWRVTFAAFGADAAATELADAGWSDVRARRAGTPGAGRSLLVAEARA